MKKKLVIIIPAVAIALAAVIAACVYMSNTRNIEVAISSPLNSNNSSYIQRLLFATGNTKGTKQEHIKQVSDDLNDFTATFIAEHKEPYYIELKYENIDKKTVVTFKGEVIDKETGNLVEFSKVFSYDFFITDKINKNFTDYKYFN